MAKYDVDLIIKARDQASAVFADVGRNARREAGKINRKGGGKASAAFGGAAKAAGAAAIGAAAAGIALATAAMYKGIQASIEYEDALAKVNTMLSGDSAATMSTYKAELRSLSQAYGQSTTVLADGLYNVLSAGVDAADAIAVLDAATRAAIAGNTDAATSVDALTTVLNAYGLEASQTGAVSDVMFQVVKDGKITFGQLAANIATVAPMANAAGVAFDELGGLIATAVKVEKPERAMTQISAVMRSAAKEGLNLFDYLNKFEGMDLTAILGTGATDETAKGIALLTSESGALAAEIQRMKSAAGAAGEAFGKMADTKQFKINQIKQSWNIMLQRVGDSVASSEWFSKALEKTGEVMRNLPEIWNIAVAGIQISGLQLMVVLRAGWLGFGEFVGNIIDVMSDRFGGMIAAATTGMEALKKGDLSGAAASGKAFAKNLAASNFISVGAEAARRTPGTLAAALKKDPLAQGLSQQIAELQKSQAKARQDIAANNADFADKMAGGIGQAAANFGLKAGEAAGNKADGKDDGNKNTGPAPAATFAATASRFLTGAAFTPMQTAAGKMQQAGQVMLNAAKTGQKQADKTAAPETATANKVVDLLSRILAAIDPAEQQHTILYGGAI